MLRNAGKKRRTDPCSDDATHNHHDNFDGEIRNARFGCEGKPGDRGDCERCQADEQIDANCAMRIELEDRDQKR